MSTTEEAGLRERKKRRTREAIVSAALRLFDKNGFGATTIADIAAAADISPRTFFGYFPSKEAVLFAEHDPSFAAFTHELSLPREDTALDVLQRWIHAFLTDNPPDPEREEIFHRLKATDPSVAAFERQMMARFEDAMTPALADDLGLPADDLRPRMVAAAAIASLRAMAPVDEDGCKKPKHDFAGPEELKRLDDALLFLRSGLAALLPAQ